MSSTSRSPAEIARLASPLIILAVGIGGFLVFGRPPELPKRESETRIALVETSPIEAFREPLEIEVEGVALPYRQVTVSAEVAGRVVHKEAKARAGSFVRQDDFLLRIDPTDYELEVARTRSELQKAQEDLRAVEVDISNTEAMIELADEDLKLRQRELERRRRLLGGAISESEVDEAQRLELNSRNSRQSQLNQIATLRQRQATLKATEALVEVQLKRAGVDLNRTRVVSPLTGTVTRHHVEEGDFVGKGDPLLLLSGSERMEVKCSLRVDQLYWLWLQAGVSQEGLSDGGSAFRIPKTQVAVAFEFEGSQYEWTGVLARYEGTGLDADTRMVPCRVEVDQPTRVKSSSGSPAESRFSVPTLFSGMYVKVRIPISVPVELLALPARAVRPGGKVWLVRDGKLAIETVKVVHPQDDQVVVLQPTDGRIHPGEQVVTSPLSHVRSGMPVTQAEAQ